MPRYRRKPDPRPAQESRRPRTISPPASPPLKAAPNGRLALRGEFLRRRLAIAPDNPPIATSLYDAYLELGRQEAAAGRLESARSAFAGAVATDSSRPDAAMALERLAPYSRAIVVDGFAGPERFVATSDGDSTSAYGEGAFSCIFQNQVSSPASLSEADDPLTGQDFAALLRIDETSGDGMVTIETRTDPAGGNGSSPSIPRGRRGRCSSSIRKRAVRHADRAICLRDGR